MCKFQLLLLFYFFFLAVFSSVNSKAWPFSTGKQGAPNLQNAKDISVPHPLTKSKGHGGENGTEFDDIEHFIFDKIAGIHSINITSGDQVNSIEVVYILADKSLVRAPRHGNKPSATSVNITFEPEEEIIKIEGKTNGQLVDQLTFITIGPNYEHRVYGPFGKTGTLSFEFDGQVIAFFGRSGDMMDNIGVYYLNSLKKSESYGGSQDNDFDDYYELNYPTIVSIRSLNVWSTDEVVTGIQVEYILLDGSFFLGFRHGDFPDSDLATILFEDEILISLIGKVASSVDGDTTIGQLMFITQKENGESGMYGPYGKGGSQNFTITGNIISFFGNSGKYINRIGVYYV